MSKKKILVTGATGFIGRNIYEFYRKDSRFEVFAAGLTRIKRLYRKRHSIDLIDEGAAENLIHDIQPDILIHAAAITSGARDIIERPWIHVANNILMNTFVMEAAHEFGVDHVIFPSCTVVYPSGVGGLLREEDVDQSNYFPPYQGAATVKMEAEGLAKFYASLGRTKYTVLRHSNVYGPHDKFDLERSHVTGATITKVMQAEDGGVVEMWGDPKIRRDVMYIDDMVEVIDHILTLSKTLPDYSVFNIGMGGIGYTIELIGHKIAVACKKNVRFEWDSSKPSLPFDIQLDVSQAKKVLGWLPQTTLEAGLERTALWYKENIARA
ncbi:MAG: NAD-dependent epimerase/dehydratase family protein [bacterium]|nr:NAD-dependent epimerase/dehydratase family protein [bacterium]